MRGRLWLRNFFDVVDLRWKKTPDVKKKNLGTDGTDSEWTKFMGGVMDDIGERMNCYVMRKREGVSSKQLEEMTEAEKTEQLAKFIKGYWEESSERFNIDAVFIDKAEYGLHIGGPKGIKYGPFALPAAVAELENSLDVDRICYCLWKVLCVRAPVRALVCYQNTVEMIARLRKRLEEVIWGSSLMKGTDGDLLVIIGDESKKDEVPWKEYFAVFEWRRDRLEKVEGSF